MHPNFNLNEMYQWPKRQKMLPRERAMLESWIAEARTPQTDANGTKVLKLLQQGRDYLNLEFRDLFGPIGIVVLCGFRPKKWELYRGRTGGSTHVENGAADVKHVLLDGTKISQKGHDMLMDALMTFWANHNGGLARKGSSFIHIDIGRRRRWKY